MRPIKIGISLYLNVPQPVALKYKITAKTEFVLLDDEDQLMFVRKESLTNGRRS